VRCDAARAPEQTERRHLPQDIVCNDGGRLLDLLGADDVDAGRHVGDPLLRAGRRDRELFDDVAGPEPHFDGLRHLGRQVDRDVLKLKSRGRHPKRIHAGCESFDCEALVRAGRDAAEVRGRQRCSDLRTHNRQPLRVEHRGFDAAISSCLCERRGRQCGQPHNDHKKS
jgi:hypothetical protein